jgi:tetratricopeptide (TPR) repeat protein
VEELIAAAEESVEDLIAAREASWEKHSPRIAMLGVLLIHGQWAEAREVAETSIASEPMFGIRDESVRVLAVLSRNCGNVDDAWEQVERYFPNGPDVQPGGIVFAGATAMQRLAAELSLDALNLPAAHAWLTAHDAWLAWSGVVLGQAEGALLWAQYHRASGEHGRALEYADRSIALASSPRQPLALIAAHRFRGQLATDENDALAAEHHLTTSLELADACRAPFERALTLLAIAELDVARAQVDAACEKLTEVRVICEPLGARPTLEHVAALEQRIGGPS